MVFAEEVRTLNSTNFQTNVFKNINFKAFTEALTLIKFTAGRVTNQDISLLRAETKEEMKNKDLQGRTNSITTAT